MQILCGMCAIFITLHDLRFHTIRVEVLLLFLISAMVVSLSRYGFSLSLSHILTMLILTFFLFLIELGLYLSNLTQSKYLVSAGDKLLWVGVGLLYSPLDASMSLLIGACIASVFYFIKRSAGSYTSAGKPTYFPCAIFLFIGLFIDLIFRSILNHS